MLLTFDFLLVSGKRHILLQRRCKILVGDSIYKLYINTVYLLLRDAKLLLRDSIYKLYINTVYPLLRDAKLLLTGHPISRDGAISHN